MSDLYRLKDVRAALLLLIACQNAAAKPPPPAAPAMVEVPAGSFAMGCNETADKQCNADEKPAHLVSLSRFFIDRTKVSQGDYSLCIAAGRCTPPSAQFDPIGHRKHPVNFVSWDQARLYCAWAGKRLPTEAEREYASRGKDGRIFPWGNAPPTCALAAFQECGGATAPVDSHPGSASPFGAQDMAGNLWEWTADWYAPDAYAHSTAQDPRGPDAGTMHAKRGGSSSAPASWLRTSRRWFHGAGGADDIGFRCAK